MNFSNLPLLLAIHASAGLVAAKDFASYEGKAPAEGCYPESTRPVRNGERFKFNLFAGDSVCGDEVGKQFQFGSFPPGW